MFVIRINRNTDTSTPAREEETRGNGSILSDLLESLITSAPSSNESEAECGCEEECPDLPLALLLRIAKTMKAEDTEDNTSASAGSLVEHIINKNTEEENSTPDDTGVRDGFMVRRKDRIVTVHHTTTDGRDDMLFGFDVLDAANTYGRVVDLNLVTRSLMRTTAAGHEDTFRRVVTLREVMDDIEKNPALTSDYKKGRLDAADDTLRTLVSGFVDDLLDAAAVATQEAAETLEASAVDERLRALGVTIPAGTK